MTRSVFSTLFIFALCLPLSAQNQSDQAMLELGRRLFYDADLSIYGTMSCSTCHEQKRAFSDGNRMHPGALGDAPKRNVPGLANVSLFKNLNWADNHLSGLAEQARIPIRGTEPVEMGMNGYEEELGKRLGQSACYQKLFTLAFEKEEGAINLDTVTRALARFEETLISDNSIYDQMHRRNQPLPTQTAEAGKRLFFGAAQCSTCHSTPLFSDDDFHQIQSPKQVAVHMVNDNGLMDVTGNVKDKDLFRTPSLRNAALTAPYWHDGSVKTLKEAIKKHNLEEMRALDAEALNHLVAFIETLTDESFITNLRYAKAPKACPF